MDNRSALTSADYSNPLRIRLYGDPVLHQIADPIASVTDEVRKLAKDMLATMYACSNGIGLAATQVGILKRLVVIDINREDLDCTPLVLINPEIESTSGSMVMEEGCLSLPEITGEVNRAENVIVSALDLDGNPITLKADDMLARAILHEIDHLNGILFIDLISSFRRKVLQRKLRKIRRISRQFQN